MSTAIEVSDIERKFERVDYRLQAETSLTHPDRYVLIARCVTIFVPPMYDFQDARCWMFGRPYRLYLMNQSVTHLGDHATQLEYEFMAIPVVADLRHPVLVHRKRKVSYPHPWAS